MVVGGRTTGVFVFSLSGKPLSTKFWGVSGMLLVSAGLMAGPVAVAPGRTDFACVGAAKPHVCWCYKTAYLLVLQNRIFVGATQRGVRVICILWVL
jgi:hypothetical protein